MTTGKPYVGVRGFNSKEKAEQNKRTTSEVLVRNPVGNGLISSAAEYAEETLQQRANTITSKGYYVNYELVTNPNNFRKSKFTTDIQEALKFIRERCK